MSDYLFTHIDKILTRIENIPRVFLFLDYDGTLAPIAPKPDKATLPPEGKTLLTTLCRQFTVAIISGRSLTDVKNMVPIPEIILAGNHGFEISSPSGSWVYPEARNFENLISQLTARLESALMPFSGALVENKGLTLSVHYRQVRDEDEKEVKSIFHQTVEPLRERLRITMGKRVLEARPNIPWDKGKAVERLSQLYSAPPGDRIYIGDDQTDEDAFGALKEDITVCVGQKDNTAAKYWVKDTEEVWGFLRMLGKTGE